MAKLTRFVVVSAAVVGLMASSLTAHAISPTLSLYSTGSGDSVQLSVSGDPYSNVLFYYQPSGYGYESQYLGSTDSRGVFSTVISASSYGITGGAYVYVSVDNQQSSQVAWPYGATTQYNPSYYNPGYPSGYGQVTLSQNNISLDIGRTTTVSVYGNGGYYVYNNNQNVASAYISGSTVTVTGVNYGTSSMSICQTGGQCATLTVTVNYSAVTASPVTFSQSVVSLGISQQTSITISGGLNNGYTGTSCGYYTTSGYYVPCTSTGYYGSGSYYVAYTSNSNAIRATVSGSTLTLAGLANTAGVVVVCASNDSCGAITVTVGVSGTNGYPPVYNPNPTSGNWTFCANENQLCSFPGSTQTIRYGANGSYYYGTFTNSVTCSNATFGDPAPGYVKQCSYSVTGY